MTEPRPSLYQRMRSIRIFWVAILLLALGLGLADLIQHRPELLRGWPGLAIAGLLAGVLAGYGAMEWVALFKVARWPVPYAVTLAYVAWELLLVILLLRFSGSFIGPLYMLLAQISATQPFRRWPVPMAAVLIVLAMQMGLYASLRANDWGDALGIVLSLAIFVGVFTVVAALFQEHYKREELMAELRRAKADLERYASQAEELAVLRERTRLAREMHDSLGHALVLVNVKLEAAERLYAVSPERGAGELQATRQLVRGAMTDLRRSLADLRSSDQPGADLPLALRQHAEEWRRRTRLELTCTLPERVPPIAPAVAEAFWAVAREALANIERHAAASRASLELRAAEDLELRIGDNGLGVSPAALARPGHYGIVGMRERIEAVGGAFSVGRAEHGGTLVVARARLGGKEHP
ncbi:MAG TPA: sensor histidine kinase [Herpetosiphonaceae bacterium]|nr:sensor histidine kinase [Herpetosiphonaceae bacterium]